MSGAWWFIIGLAVLPVVYGIAFCAVNAKDQFRHWYTRPYPLEGEALEKRRTIITALVVELLDARHVRAFRLPFNRVFVIRSTPKQEYDFISRQWVVVGEDFDNTREVIGRALDELGYEAGGAMGERDST